VPRTAPLAWEHHGNSALRDGKWKIVTEYRDNQPTKWELYDMESDRTELHDLAATQPEKLKELLDKWQAWADRVGVQPWPLKRLARWKTSGQSSANQPQSPSENKNHINHHPFPACRLRCGVRGGSCP
jgi:arylsulfatase A-like enzyme